MTDALGEGAHELPGLDLDEAWADYGARQHGKRNAGMDLMSLVQLTTRREIAEAEARREARFSARAREIISGLPAAEVLSAQAEAIFAASRPGFAARRGAPAPASGPFDPSHGENMMNSAARDHGKDGKVFP